MAPKFSPECSAATRGTAENSSTTKVADEFQYIAGYPLYAQINALAAKKSGQGAAIVHLLARGPTIPPAWLSRRWRFHTHGSFRIDIQPVRSPAHAAGYLVGYTIGQRKKEQQVHLTSWPGPRVRYSQGYFPARVAEIRAQLLAAWQESAGEEKATGSWEWIGPAGQQRWRWRLAARRTGTDPGQGWIAAPQNAPEGAREPHREPYGQRQTGTNPPGGSRPTIQLSPRSGQGS